MPNNISKRISLTNAQKRQLCLDKEKKPAPTNGELALKYRIKRKTVSAILIAKENWLTTDSGEYTAQLKQLYFVQLNERLICVIFNQRNNCGWIALSINKLCCCNIVVYITYISCND